MDSFCLAIIGDRHPAGLADAQVLEAAVDRQAPVAGGAVQGGGEAFFDRRHIIYRLIIRRRTIILAQQICVR
jgi:hypothetical protein